jgi:putative Holliday junction resolvase
MARVGVACSTLDGLVCSPLTTLVNDSGLLGNVALVLSENEPIEIYVGLPLNLQGLHTASTEGAIGFARELENFTVAVRLMDERLTTRGAQAQLLASGKNTRKSKTLIDAAAATLILESAIAFEKATGRLPGKELSEFNA